LLQHYRVLLDPLAGRMVFKRTTVADPLPLRSTSGLLMGVESDRLKVLHVMRGGPAEADGWKVGDLICTIDGVKIPRDYPTSPIATWAVRPAGSAVTIGGCDGTSRILTLRNFY
jgi:C-terminal processing protease CtpA/Prc